MWDRLLIKCDWLLTLESKKQISLWHVYLYIYGSDQVSAMQPPLLQIDLGRKRRRKKGKEKKGKEMCNLFCACLYFEEDILNQNR